MPQSNLSIALHSRPFQMAGARFAMEHRRVVIADEPGLGKTIQSIAAVIGCKTTGSVLIVAPKTAAYVTWPAELRRWLAEVAPGDPVRILGGKLDKRGRLDLLAQILHWEPSEYEQRQWVIMSPNYLRFRYKLDARGNYEYDDDGDKILLPVREALPSLLYHQWQAVIVDEAHETLAGATGNPKKHSAQSRGLRLLDIAPDGLRIALSGTPFRGKHEHLWGLLNWVDPDAYNDTGGRNSYWKWIHRHFDVYHDEVYNQDIVGNLRSERDLAKEARKHMIRRTKKLVLPELPDKMYGGQPRWPAKQPPGELTRDLHNALELQRLNPGVKQYRLSATVAQERLGRWYDKNNPVAVWLEMDGPQKTAYNQMKKEAAADFENGTLLANSILAEMTRLRQFANSYGRLDDSGQYQPALPSNKFDWLLQFLRERGIDGPEPSGSRVVVASQFTRHINLFAHELRERYKIPCYVLTGQTTTDARVQLQEEFQSGTLASGAPSPEVLLLNIKAGGNSITLDAADDMVVVDRTHNVDDQVQLEDRIHRLSRIHSVTIHNLITLGTVDEQIYKKTKETGRSLRRILDTPQKALELLES